MDSRLSITLALRLHAALGTESKLLTNEDDVEFILEQIRGLTDNVRIRRLFLMSANGNRAIEFHRRCDNKGPTITLIRTAKGVLCGGYIRTPWRSLNKSVRDDDCVLFRLTKHNGERFSQRILSNDAIEDHRNLGPRFDWGGLSASSNLLAKEGYLMTKGDQYHCKNNPRCTLVPLPDGTHPLTLERSDSGKMIPFEIEELEVF